MKPIYAAVFLSFLCVLAIPASAHKVKLPKDHAKKVAEIEKEQLEHRIWYLLNKTERLENQVRKENRAKHAQSAKRVDRDFLPKLKKAAQRGDEGLWHMIHQDYMHERSIALKNDQKAYEARQAKKKENPWYREPLNP